MHTALMSVLEFHEKMGLAIGDPRKPDLSVDTQLRWDLIHEEFQELTLALEGKDKHGNKLDQAQQVIEVADALGDLCYVIAGAAAAWGIDLAGVFDAIHDSNMTKTPGNKREDGKILKGDNYVPPDIKGALAQAQADTDKYGLGEDCWWPTPTVSSGLEMPYSNEDVKDPKQWVEDMVEQAARPHKLKAAMKEIKEDFVTQHHLPAELASELLTKHGEVFCETFDAKEVPAIDGIDEPRDTDPTAPEPLNGAFSQNEYVFDCLCGRTQTVPTKLGSRGGRAQSGHVECMCGKRYEFQFGEDKRRNQTIYKYTVIDLGEPGVNR